MEYYKYKDIEIKLRLCGKDWGSNTGKILFTYLEKSEFFDSFKEGKKQIESEIDLFLETDYKSMNLQDLIVSIEQCFYTDEGGGLYRNQQMLKVILKNLNPNLK